MENKLPTAEEFLNTEQFYSVSNEFDTQQAMIAFAKLHVKAALEAAKKKVIMKDDNEDCHYEDEQGNFPEMYSIDKNSILNAYPEDLIK